MNSENSKTSEPHFLILTLTDKLCLKRGERVFSCEILVFITHGKHKKPIQ